MNINSDNCLPLNTNYFRKGDVIYINNRNHEYKIISHPVPYTSVETGDVWLYELDKPLKDRHINEVINDQIKNAESRYKGIPLINKLNEIIKRK